MKILKAERSPSKVQKQKWRQVWGWGDMRVKCGVLAERVDGTANYEMAPLELLFKGPTSSVCRDCGWRVSFGVQPVVLALSKLGGFCCFSIKIFTQIMVGPHEVLRSKTEPWPEWRSWLGVVLQPKGLRFDSHSRHVPGLWVWSPVRASARGSQSVFLT